MSDVGKTISSTLKNTLGDQVGGGIANATGVEGVWNAVGKATGVDQFHPEIYNPLESAFGPNEQEKALTEAILARAQGRGAPSPAELQQQAALQQQGAQAMGMAAAQRGVSPALAARQAQQAMAQAGQQTAQNAAILRAQETLGAEQLGQQGIQSQRQARENLEQLKSGNKMAQQQMEGQGYESSANRLTGTIKAAGQAAGVGMADGGMIPQMQSAEDAQAHSFASMVGQQVGQMMAKGIAGQNTQNLGDMDWTKLGNKIKDYQDSGTGGFAGSEAKGIGQSMMAAPMSKGGQVNGKAIVNGNSPDNDIVPAMLSPGEIVIPRTIAKQSPEKIAQFVMALRGGM